MKPAQPIFHLRPSLALIRTTMGLTLMGKFSREWFETWTPTAKKVMRMKKALMIGPGLPLTTAKTVTTSTAKKAVAAAAAERERLLQQQKTIEEELICESSLRWWGVKEEWQNLFGRQGQQKNSFISLTFQFFLSLSFKN